jgi:hypothetical protein
MQKIPDQSSEGDRRLIRRWGIASIGFYGSILAGMILYAALHPNPNVNVASAIIKAPISAMKVAHH